MRWLALVLIVALVGCKGRDANAPIPERGEIVRLQTADGTKLHSEIVRSNVEPNGVVLMFHQAGSNLHEYDPIAPRIAAQGWDCLKVDQRAGGEMWGATNKTVEEFKGSQPYLSAYADLEGALAWAKDEGYETIIAWGSSYSASLVLRLASEHKEIDAVVSFSPGEYFEEKGTVAKWASEVSVPTFFAATSAELLEGVYAIYDAKSRPNSGSMDDAFGTNDGVHGSSALRKDKNPKDYQKYWERLEKFIRALGSDGKNFGG